MVPDAVGRSTAVRRAEARAAACPECCPEGYASGRGRRRLRTSLPGGAHRRGLPKDVSAPLRACFEQARDDMLERLRDDMGEDVPADLSLGEGWVTAEELARVSWDPAARARRADVPRGVRADVLRAGRPHRGAPRDAAPAHRALVHGLIAPLRGQGLEDNRKAGRRTISGSPLIGAMTTSAHRSRDQSGGHDITSSKRPPSASSTTSWPSPRRLGARS